MKVNCPTSGISYIIPTPVRGQSVSIHPMLSRSIKVADLVSWYVADWAQGKLAIEQTHLLGLAFLQKLPVESIAFSPLTDADLDSLDKLWCANMEKLAKLAARLEGRAREFRRLPRFVMSEATASNLPEWLGYLETELAITSAPISDKAKELNKQNYKALVESSSATVSMLLEPEQVESMVIRALNESLLTASETKALPVVIADWANKVTEFPRNLSPKWQRIVQIIFHGDYINQILMSDITLDQIKAVEEHLVLNTPSSAVGTSHSSLLMKRIGEVIPVIEDFNPGKAYNRKGTGDAIANALFGEAGNTAAVHQYRSHNTAASSTGGPKLTLAEKLALRLAGKGSN
jgi:hypothetical protein